MNGGFLFAVLAVLLILLVLASSLLIFRLQNSVTQISQELRQQKSASEVLAAQESAQNRERFENLNGHLSKVYAQLGAENSALYSLQNSMKDINSVMSNAKRRGSWGEYQMETLIRVYAGQTPSLYEAQHRLENGKIADGVFHLPGSEKLLCIDSKFPMENYQNMISEPEDEAYYSRELRKNIKKHIEDVASKYITPQTADQAILFIPSEAIYQYIFAEQSDLFELALSRHVLLCSPTTLAGIVFTLVSGTQDYYRAQNVSRIEEELSTLTKEVENLEDRASKAFRNTMLLENQLTEIRQSSRRLLGRLHALNGTDQSLISEEDDEEETS